jgi:hypothetical protein
LSSYVPLTSLAFSPLTLVREFQPVQDRVTCLDWSADGAYVTWGSKDMTVYVERVATVRKKRNKKTKSNPKQQKSHSSDTSHRFILSAHRDVLVLSVFTTINGRLYLVTLSKDTLLALWRWQRDDEDGFALHHPTQEGKSSSSSSSTITSTSTSISVSSLLTTAKGMWVLEKKHLLRMHTRVYTAQLHKASNFLVVGFHNGYIFPTQSSHSPDTSTERECVVVVVVVIHRYLSISFKIFSFLLLSCRIWLRLT